MAEPRLSSRVRAARWRLAARRGPRGDRCG